LRIIVPALVIVAVLAFAFWYGGGAPGARGWDAGRPKTEENTQPQTEAQTQTETQTGQPGGDTSHSGGAPASDAQESPTPTTVSGAESPTVSEGEYESEAPSPSPDGVSAPSGGGASAVEVTDSVAPGAELDRPMTAEEKQELAEALAGGQDAAPSPSGDADYSAQLGMQIDPGTGRDRYLTDPVPEGRPIPVEPQDAVTSDTALTCTLSVRCDTILDNISWLDPEKAELVPPDGVIFPAASVTFYEGESVFDVLRREMKRAGIHLEFANTPMYNSAYIEGINNLYEFDCGELSGWMYKVNDWFPNYGCSRYALKDGDVVEWVYTCSLGVDVGGYYSVGG
jgi:hypothetical protein